MKWKLMKIQTIQILIINNNFEFKSKFLKCNDKTYSDIIEEAFKRGIKPLFIPLIVLISSLVVLYNKDNFFYSKFQYFLFFLVLIIIVLSEVSSRYIYDLRSTIVFSSLPIFLFLVSYMFLISRLKEKL